MNRNYGILVSFVIVVWLHICHGKYTDLNLYTYHKMPKLNHLDDYDICFEANPHQFSLFCYIDTTIVPNISNEVWNIIEDYSADEKHYYRHDRLRRGLCLNRCFNLFKNKTETEIENLYQPLNFNRRIDNIKRNASLFRDEKNYREKYHKLINQCINYELQRDYDLKAYSEIYYCDTSNKSGANFKHDAFDYLMLTFVVFIFIITTFSTWYDYRLRKESNLKSTNIALHYKTTPSKLRDKIFVCFSMYRNAYRLFYNPKQSGSSDKKQTHELIVINAMRFVFMYGIITVHVVMMFSATPMENGIYFEKHYHRIESMLLINGHIIIQSFYAISGFLLAVKYLNFTEKGEKMKFSYVIKATVFRYFRLVPVYALIILFNISWVIFIQDGPVWRYLVETERENCRNYWWANLLFINNYVGTSDPCLQQTWYLGTDFQLFLITLLCFWFISNYPLTKKPILVLSVLLSYIIPGAVTYYYAYEGAVIIKPEDHKYISQYSAMYLTMYIPTHTNTGSYVDGVLGGWLWYNLKKNSFDFSRLKAFNRTWPIYIALGPLFIVSAYVFYEFDFEKPSLWISFYAALGKNFWGYYICGIIIGIASGVGGALRDLLVHTFFNILGRITFCVFIVHILLLHVTMANIKKPNFLTDSYIALNSIAAFFLCYLVGGILSLFVEIPFANILRLFEGESIPKVQQELHLKLDESELKPKENL